MKSACEGFSVFAEYFLKPVFLFQELKMIKMTFFLG